MRFLTKDNRGFTLIELMAVLVIMGVFASVAIKKYNNFTDNAIIMQFDRVERELNLREMMVFIDLRISEDGYIDDATLHGMIDYNLGVAQWVGPASRTGGRVRIQGITRLLVRVESTNRKPAEWKL